MTRRRFVGLFSGMLLAGAFLWLAPAALRLALRLADPLAGLTLAEAAARGDVSRIRSALLAGADVNPTAGLWTPLMLATDGGHRAAMIVLLDAGADVNGTDARGWSPLHVAAKRGKVDAARLLVARGADPALKARDGKAPLAVARERGRAEVARWLEERQAGEGSKE
jgi:ankyrin repeat protein